MHHVCPSHLARYICECRGHILNDSNNKSHGVIYKEITCQTEKSSVFFHHMDLRLEC